jgi:HlyD family secretion protein
MGLLGLAIAAGLYFGRGNRMSVDRERLVITTVTNDQFYEYINLTARVEPRQTYLIDGKVEGNVERIYAEAGQQLQGGDTLLLISNADLELEVMQRESQLIEQLNAQRQTRLLLDQNDFTRREQLLEIDYQLDLQRKQYTRDRQLAADSLLAARDFEPTENRYAYYRRRRTLLEASYRQDSLVRRTQLRQIEASEARILDNLDQVGAILDRLYVIAPVAGYLSDFTVQTGQRLAAGERIGEIYRMDRPRLVAEADEFYLGRIREGQGGILLDRGDTVRLTVEKIYPTVTEGRFRLDIALEGAGAGAVELTKGQSLRVRLLFGPPESSTLLATGNFYGSTGGHWVYRLEENRAVRTPIRLGRSNPNYYEVLEGLSPGDRIIVSAYDDFADYETLKLN